MEIWAATVFWTGGCRQLDNLKVIDLNNCRLDKKEVLWDNSEQSRYLSDQDVALRNLYYHAE